MSVDGMSLQDYMDHARVLFRRYEALGPDDVSRTTDEARACIEQEGYALLARLIDHLHSIMPGLQASDEEDEAEEEGTTYPGPLHEHEAAWARARRVTGHAPETS